MKKTIIILILISVLAVTFIVFAARELSHMEEYRNQLKEIEAQQTSYLDNISEYSKNYNELYGEFNKLYLKYAELKANLTADKWATFTVTGYSASDPQQDTTNLLATGFNLDHKNVKEIPIVAVDPKIIPLYSIVEIQGLGAFISLDVGGAIKGNRIDILFADKDQAIEFGKQTLMARIIR